MSKYITLEKLTRYDSNIKTYITDHVDSKVSSYMKRGAGDDSTIILLDSHDPDNSRFPVLGFEAGNGSVYMTFPDSDDTVVTEGTLPVYYMHNLLIDYSDKVRVSAVYISTSSSSISISGLMSILSKQSFLSVSGMVVTSKGSIPATRIYLGTGSSSGTIYVEGSADGTYSSYTVNASTFTNGSVTDSVVRIA